MSPPYRYDPVQPSPYAGTIADIIARQGQTRAQQALTIGEAQARAAEQSGAAWGQALTGIGQTIAQVPQQIQQAKTHALDAKVREAQLQAHQTTIDAAKQRQADLTKLDEILAQPGGLDEVLSRTPGHLRDEVMKDYETASKLRTETKQQQDAARKSAQEFTGFLGTIVRKHDYDPTASLSTLHFARELYADDPSAVQQIDQMRQRVIADPDAIREVADLAIAHSSYAKVLEPKAAITHDPTKELLDPETLAVRKPAVPAEMTPYQRAQLGLGRERVDLQRAQQGQNEPIVQTMGPGGVPIWTPRSEAIGKQAAQAPRAVTGAERQSLAYYNRARQAVETLTIKPTPDVDSLEQRMAKQSLGKQAQLQYAPNVLQNEDQQAYRQAQRAFTEARLRKESGAAIPTAEYENDARTYFAQPGDSVATITQKQQARQVVLDGLKFAAGKAFDEYYGEPNVSPSRTPAAPKADPLGLFPVKK